MADADFVQTSRHGEAQRRIIRVAAEHPCKWKNRVVVRVRLALKSAYRLHAHHIRECTAQPRRLLRVVVYDHELVLCRLAREAAVNSVMNCVSLSMWSSFMPFIPSFSHFLKNLRLYGVNHTLSMADCQSHIPTERFSASSTSSLTF